MRLIKPSSAVIYLTRVAVFSRENVLLQSVFKLYWWGDYTYTATIALSLPFRLVESKL